MHVQEIDFTAGTSDGPGAAGNNGWHSQATPEQMWGPGGLCEQHWERENSGLAVPSSPLPSSAVCSLTAPFTGSEGFLHTCLPATLRRCGIPIVLECSGPFKVLQDGCAMLRPFGLRLLRIPWAAVGHGTFVVWSPPDAGTGSCAGPPPSDLVGHCVKLVVQAAGAIVDDSGILYYFSSVATSFDYNSAVCFRLAQLDAPSDLLHVRQGPLLTDASVDYLAGMEDDDDDMDVNAFEDAGHEDPPRERSRSPRAMPSQQENSPFCKKKYRERVFAKLGRSSSTGFSDRVIRTNEKLDVHESDDGIGFITCHCL